jgi:nitrate reductase beta subunit
VYKLIDEWGLALPLHAEYRTLPMVWYIPPMSPILSRIAERPALAEADEMRIPVAYLAELFSAGDPQPVKDIINKLVAIRLHMRARELGQPEPDQSGQAVALAPETLDAMYRLLAVAKRAERFNIPEAISPSREAMLEGQRTCGFTFEEGFRS